MHYLSASAMSSKGEEAYGSVGLSQAGVGGMAPLNLGGLTTSLHLNNDIQAATQIGMATGALTAAQLARGNKPLAVAAPVAPVAAPMVPAPVAAAPAAAPAAQIGANRHHAGVAPGADPSSRLLNKLAVHKVSFSASFETSLAELQANPNLARSEFRFTSPAGIQHANVVVRELKVTHLESTSRQALGLRLGDLPTKLVQSLPNGKQGNTFHCKVPRMDQPPMCKAKIVFELADLIDPNHLERYAKYKSREDLMAEAVKVPGSATYHVKPHGAIGYVMTRNHEKTSGAIVIEDAGEKVIIARADVVEKIADAIYEHFIANKTFQSILSQLDRFPIELVPLNHSNKWTDVIELSVEDAEVQQRELQRRFSVTVMGEAEVLAVTGGQ